MDIFTIAQTAWSSFAQSYFFLALKIFLGIYTLVLILDIILILSFRDLGAMARQRKFGTPFVPSLSKKAFQKEWSKIEQYLASSSPDEYKMAILSADALVEGVLNDTGYAGDDMSQQLNLLQKAKPHEAELLTKAHQLRNRIIFEKNFTLDKATTKETLEVYKDYLKKFDFFG
jgi:hypothetical protein